MKILVIIPAYNEEENILNTVSELKKYHPEYDLLVVNDSSKDKTREVLRKNKINHLDLPINLGIGGGVQAGYLYARENDYDVAIQLDGDGQHCPSELEKLVAPVVNGEADMTVGSRFLLHEGFQSSAMRRVGIFFLSKVIYICSKQRVLDCTSGFRCVNKRFIDIFAEEYAQDYPEPEAIVTVGRHGGHVVEVPTIMRDREGGKSSISPLKSVYYMIKVSLAIMIQSTMK